RDCQNAFARRNSLVLSTTYVFCCVAHGVPLEIGVTGQYHKTCGVSSRFWPQAVLTEERSNAMKYNALFGLRLLLGLVLLAAGSGQTGGLGLVVQQIETIGPRQWLSLMAGSIVSSAVRAGLNRSEMS